MPAAVPATGAAGAIHVLDSDAPGRMTVTPALRPSALALLVLVPAPTAGPALAADSGADEWPRVTHVGAAAADGEIQMRDSLDEALNAIFGAGDAAVVEPPPVTGDGGEVPEEVASLVAAAEQALAEADAALRAGDLGTYADKVAEAQDFIARAATLIAAEGGG